MRFELGIGFNLRFVGGWIVDNLRFESRIVCNLRFGGGRIVYNLRFESGIVCNLRFGGGRIVYNLRFKSGIVCNLKFEWGGTVYNLRFESGIFNMIIFYNLYKIGEQDKQEYIKKFVSSFVASIILSCLEHPRCGNFERKWKRKLHHQAATRHGSSTHLGLSIWVELLGQSWMGAKGRQGFCALFLVLELICKLSTVWEVKGMDLNQHIPELIEVGF